MWFRFLSVAWPQFAGVNLIRQRVASGQGVPLSELVRGRLEETGLKFEAGGRNTYPISTIVPITKG